MERVPGVKMADPKKYMEKIDMKQAFPTLNHAQQVFVKRIEKENYYRAQIVRNLRRRNAKFFFGAAGFVGATCRKRNPRFEALIKPTDLYTMYAIRQEKYEEFDDGLETPETTKES